MSVVISWQVAFLIVSRDPLRYCNESGYDSTMPAMTQAGMILGVAAYLSPEQGEGRTGDARSDVAI